MRTQAEEMVESFARGTAPAPIGSPFGGVVTGFATGASPPGVVPGAIVGTSVGGAPGNFVGPAITIIGPNGQPVTIRSPIRPPEPGLIALPPGAYTGPVPPIPPPPASEPRQLAPADPALRR